MIFGFMFCFIFSLPRALPLPMPYPIRDMALWQWRQVPQLPFGVMAVLAVGFYCYTFHGFILEKVLALLCVFVACFDPFGSNFRVKQFLLIFQLIFEPKKGAF